MKKSMLVSVLCLFVAGTTNAGVLPDYQGSGITLVEATWTDSATPIADGSNTFLAGGVEGQYALPANSSSYALNSLWNHRTGVSAWDFPGLVNDRGHGWADFGATVDLERITVQHAVAEGVYEVYAIYFGKANSTGAVAAGLSGGTLQDYNATSPDAILLAQPADYGLFAVKVGTQIGSLLSIDFDQASEEFAFDKRVTPVGLGYTVVPEPATMVLLGLGTLLLRRKK